MSNLQDKIYQQLTKANTYFSEDTQKAAIITKAREELARQITSGEIEYDTLKAALPDFEYNGEDELPVSKLIEALKAN
ncbi:hypothetical protein [Vibrio fluvialis]|uniref:hypothetical protein n=1 Tax=Vibrio fluvialis TaxID=676 RepID=UPI001EE9E92D|nr:hypothetical protein [Vibrio fluvialis]MCG6368732.1 hypothetical protein [Vibrio fluvialis]MCG6377433.1 hypothetical protein [Vibrio fluvialis]